MIGHPIHHEAALVIEKLGGDVSDFAARQLTARIASSADLVLAMTTAHRDAVLELAPSLLRTTFTLSQASRLASEYDARTIADLARLRPHLGTRDLSEIPDPIGQSAEFFATIGTQISALLAPIVELCGRRD